jgi:hypothetical protein
MSAGLSDEGLACPGRAVQQDALPGLASAFEDLREADGHDDCFLEGVFGLIEACHIIPGDIGLLPDDDSIKIILHLLFLVLGLIVEYLLSLIILDVVTHLPDVFFELV